MDYNIEFQICSLIIVSMLMAVFFSKTRVLTLENRIYGYILVSLFIVSLTDIGSVITLATPDRYPMLTHVMAKLYLMEMIGVAALLSIYTIALSLHGKKDRIPKYRGLLMKAWIFFAVVCMAAVPFLDLYSGGYGRHVYTSGTAVSLTYTVGGLAVVGMLLVTFLLRKEIPWKKQLPIYAYAIVEAVTTVIQKTHPYYLLTTFSMAVSVFFMYLTLENPDLKLIRALNEAKDEAEQANRAKTAFLANMSHEIRTPINAVMGMNEMIIRESKSPQIEEYAMHIQNASSALLSIVNNILDFAKIESGKMNISSEKYSLTQMLFDVVSLTEFKAQSKKLSFQYHIQRDLPCKLIGDETHIRQIILNLLSNAVKYTQQGHIILALEGQKISDSSVLLRVKISDTGIGIKQEDIAKLTQSFRPKDVDYSHAMAGTGLGLSIASGLLKMMDAKLCIASEYGKGSVFSFDIIQKVEEWEPIGDFETHFEQSVENTGSGRTIWAEKAKVLIVDDNAMNISVVKGLLKRTGIQLVCASSGAEAVELVTDQRFDLVFLDHMMPEMDGIETYQSIRKLWESGENTKTLPGTPFIVQTANAVIGAKEMYLEKGFTDYLSKPIDYEQLELMLKKYLPRNLWVEKNIAAAGAASEDTNGNTEMVQEAFVEEFDSAIDPEYAAKQQQYFSLLWETRKQILEQASVGENVLQTRIAVREMLRQMQFISHTEAYVPLQHMLNKIDQLFMGEQQKEAIGEIPTLLQLTEDYLASV